MEANKIQRQYIIKDAYTNRFLQKDEEGNSLLLEIQNNNRENILTFDTFESAENAINDYLPLETTTILEIYTSNYNYL